MTKLVHGEAEATESSGGCKERRSAAADDLSNMPTVRIRQGYNWQAKVIGVVSFIKELGLVPSNREGFMTIEQGGLKLDGEKGDGQETDDNA